ncbi:MAG: RnfABCDGE type electron transport complex subunit D [Bacteroidales bacterium]|nr:RnfABCDGE type electron transport complex subunit D [Bacteroidales bacterium]
MDNKQLAVSLSPHVQGPHTTQKLMLNVVLALMPAMAVSLFYFGIGTLIVTLISVGSCVLFEYLIQRFVLRVKPTVGDLSAVVTGIILAFNVPSNLPWYIVVLGALVAIGMAKMSFGGLGNNIFNPAIVARVFLLISFPVQMTSWPLPIESRLQYTDALTGATPLALLKEGLGKGQSVAQIDLPSHMDMFMGLMGGSLGEVSALALLIGMVWLLATRTITWHIPVSIIGTVLVLTGAMWLIAPDTHASPLFHLLTGGLLLGAIFMATDYVTSPMHPSGMWVYGIGIGLLTVVIRVWGSYPEGMSFAILIMNGAVPLINRYMKPKRFGERRADK